MSQNGKTLAQTPPMGWNSYDCFGASVTEEQVKANADYMAAHLKQYGWEYIVIDITWYAPADLIEGQLDRLVMDDYGRFIPDIDRFPSAKDGAGLKPLADYIHSLGLKFGIHIMRGICKVAVEKNLPIFGTDYHAQDIADTSSICDWCPNMFGVKTDHPGAQAWYDSNLALYSAWGVDFIKADDFSTPYHKGEIELLHNAIEGSGRPMVLSLSPGQTPIQAAEHVKRHAEMWRISCDFWDNWEDLHRAFELAERWQEHIGPGHWPDSDMLPLGHLEVNPFRLKETRYTWLNKDEQITLMTLWCISRSPLMFGGNLPDNDEWTNMLLTNPEVLGVLKESSDNHQLFRTEASAAWVATAADGSAYLALFNLKSEAAEVKLHLDECGFPGNYHFWDLWERCELGLMGGAFSIQIPGHGAKLFKLISVI